MALTGCGDTSSRSTSDPTAPDAGPPPATTANEGTGSPVTGSPPNPTLVPSPYGELFFAEHRGTGHPDAQLTGRLVVDEEGCLRLIGMSQAPGETIIWLPRYDLAVDGNKLRILGSNGEVVATVGDYVEMSGGHIGDTLGGISGVNGRTGRELEERCPGEYVFTGVVVSAEQPRSVEGEARRK